MKKMIYLNPTNEVPKNCAWLSPNFDCQIGKKENSVRQCNTI